MNTVNVRNIVIGEGIPKICVPIVGKTKEELLSEVEVLKSVPVDVVEWRMDWFEEVECCEKAVAMLQVLREAMPEMPILATFRSKKEGGELEISTAAYVELNKAIIDSGNADLIDVELFTGEAQVKELIAHAHDKGVRVIMSNHDFDKTPSYNEILTRLKAMQTLGADIPKIAVMPICKADVITLLQATNDMHENFADHHNVNGGYRRTIQIVWRGLWFCTDLWCRKKSECTGTDGRRGFKNSTFSAA